MAGPPIVKAALILMLAALGAAAEADAARGLRRLGRLAQPVGDAVMLAAATVLVLEGFHLHLLDEVLLR